MHDIKYLGNIRGTVAEVKDIPLFKWHIEFLHHKERNYLLRLKNSISL